MESIRDRKLSDSPESEFLKDSKSKIKGKKFESDDLELYYGKGRKGSLFKIFNSESSLFLVFAINFCTSVQYYILVTLIPLYFTEVHFYSDFESGMIFGGFGIVIGVFSLYLSSILHKISFKRGLYLSFTLGILGFILMLSENSYLSIFSVLVLHSLSCSMTWPYAEYAIKEYAPKSLMNLANSCFFMSNYLAGIIVGLIIDSMWISYDDKSFVYYTSSLFGIASLGFAFVFLFLCRDLKNMDNEDLEADGLWKLKRFWRFSLLIFLLILLRSASFGHLDATLPKYLTRIKGNNGHFGIMLAIHSCTMMIGLFLLTTLTFKYSSYTLIIIGAALGSVASFFIMISDEMISFVLFVICLSVGESIWVPRLLDYTYAVAPEGKEGIYLAMSNCPFYFGMILTGASSGSLLSSHCPDKTSIETCSQVWYSVFIASSLITLLLILLKKIILGPPHEKYDKLFCFRDNKKT